MLNKFWCIQFGCKVSSSFITVFKPKQVWQNPYYYNPTFYYRYKLTSLPPHQFACVSKFNSHYLKFDGKPIGCYSDTRLCLKLSNTPKRQWITFLHWKVGCLNTKSGSRDSSTSTMPGRSGSFPGGTQDFSLLRRDQASSGDQPQPLDRRMGGSHIKSGHSGEKMVPSHDANPNSSTVQPSTTSRSVLMFVSSGLKAPTNRLIGPHAIKQRVKWWSP